MMNVTLEVWRQKNVNSAGTFVRYSAQNINLDMSFLEMLDKVNQQLILRNEDPIAFDHDCREGICGSCGVMINGIAHGGRPGAAACQIHMRDYDNGDTLIVEPWRSRAFPVIKDLVVDRRAFDRIIQAGGYISAKTGGVPEANCIPVSQTASHLAMDAAACIGCGACVAACPNGSASLFVAAKVSHFALLPQGQVERRERVVKMVAAMDEEGFGNCSMHRECQAVCPKKISTDFIARMNRERLVATMAHLKTT